MQREGLELSSETRRGNMKYVPEGKRQDPVLYKALMEQRQYKMKHAENSLQFISMVVL